MRSTFYIAIHTNEVYTKDTYEPASGKLLNLMEDVFSNSLEKCTKGSFESCTVEVEISHEESGLVGKAVLDYESDSKCIVDKASVSRRCKAGSEWPLMKIEKRCVDQVVPPD